MPRKWMENHTTEFIMSAEWGTAGFLLLFFSSSLCFFKNQRCLAPGKKSYDQPRQHIKK